MDELPEVVDIIEKLNQECQREVERHDKFLKIYFKKAVMTELIHTSFKRKRRKHYEYVKELPYVEGGLEEYERKYPNGFLDIKIKDYKFLDRRLDKLFRYS